MKYSRTIRPEESIQPYKIYLDSEMTEEKVMAAGNPLNEELKQEILSIDGVTDKER